MPFSNSSLFCSYCSYPFFPMKFLSLGIKYIQSNHVKEQAGQFANSNDKKTRSTASIRNSECLLSASKNVLCFRPKPKGLWWDLPLEVSELRLLSCPKSDKTHEDVTMSPNMSTRKNGWKLKTPPKKGVLLLTLPVHQWAFYCWWRSNPPVEVVSTPFIPTVQRFPSKRGGRDQHQQPFLP